LNQQQVDGQNAILDRWEIDPATVDFRWLAYALATTFHETAQSMAPIAEYGKGKGMAYGVEDPPGSGNVFYGRGFVQLTWASNYQRATKELGLSGHEDLYKHPDKALDLLIAGDVMFFGMIEGWFRTRDGKPETLPRYFSPDGKVDDPFNARGIINGDKNTVPKWSGGLSIGKLIEGYHHAFLYALQASVPTV
jgi:hypothetical protein